MREAKEQPTEEIDEGEAPSRLLRTVLPLLVVGGLLLAHLEVLARGPGYAGPLLMVDHLFDLGMVLLLMGLLVGIGHRFLREVGLEPLNPIDTLLYAAAVGPGLWSLSLLILGFVGLLGGWSLALVALACAVVAHSELQSLPALLGRVGRETGDVVESRWLMGLAGVVTGLVAAFLLLHGSAPPGDWDSLMYHLEVPRAWLASGQIHVPDGNLHVAFVSLLHLLYVPFLAVGSEAGPALVNGVFALLLGLGIFRVGAQLFDGETGLLSSVVLWATTGLLFVAVTARVDTSVAFYLLVGQSAVVLAILEPDSSRSHLARAALVLGLAAGVKYHALAYGAAVAPVGVWALWRGEETGGDRLRVALTVLGIGLIAVAPWLLKNLILLGAPLYPFFAERVLPPWLADLYGTREVVAAVGSERAGILGEAREPFDLVALFLAPERLTVEAEAVHYHMNFLLLLLPLWALHWKNRAVAGLAAPALAYGIGVVSLGSINLRYLFPALAPLTVVTAFFAVDLLRRAPSVQPRTRFVLLGVGALLLLYPTARSTVQWTRQFPVVGQFIGTTSRQAYLQEGFTFYAALAGTVNSAVPPEGRVLLLWEARSFYLVPSVLPDNVLTNWPLLSPYVQRTGSCLEDTDITHVMASTSAARYYQLRGVDPDRLGLDAFAMFAERCLEPVRVGAGFGLYRIPHGGQLSEVPGRR